MAIESRCKICKHLNRELIEKMITDENRPIDIIRAFPELSNANITNHSGHMVPSSIENIKQLLANSMTEKNIKNMRADNVTEILKLQTYIDTHPESDETMKDFRGEFEGRLSCLEEWLERVHILDAYEPAAINGFTSMEDNEAQSKRSILAIIRHCMTQPLDDNGMVSINGLLAAAIVD